MLLSVALRMASNTLELRQSSWLDEALDWAERLWHIYHLLVGRLGSSRRYCAQCKHVAHCCTCCRA